MWLQLGVVPCMIPAVILGAAIWTTLDELAEAAFTCENSTGVGTTGATGARAPLNIRSRGARSLKISIDVWYTVHMFSPHSTVALSQ